MYAEERIKSEIIQEAMAKSGEAISTQRNGSGAIVQKPLIICYTSAVSTSID